MEPSDEELVAKVVASRDQHAFGVLVARHQSRVRNWLQHLAKDPGLADELAQDTFVRVWEKLHTFTGKGKFQSWLMKVAYTIFLQSHRSRKRRRKLAAAMKDDPTVMTGDTLTSENPGVVDLNRMLAAVSPQERHAMVLCYAYGFSHREAGAVMDIPVGTVKSHIRRGTQRIRERFGLLEGAA